MNKSDEEDPGIQELVDRFVGRVQRGEDLSIDDYCRQHPDHADALAELLAAADLPNAIKPNPDAAEDCSHNLPHSIGDYLIIREIGRGGMGVVYEAEQRSLGRRVALKVLPDFTPSEVAKVRFQREARAAARLHHTNIVPVFEVGEDGDQLFYAMQLIRGRGLDVVIEELRTGRQADQATSTSTVAAETRTTPIRNPASAAETDMVVAAPLSNLSSTDQTTNSGRRAFFRTVAGLICQAASGLDYAHERGVIHRDIKPSNLLLDPDGVLWITDFGLAKATDEDATLTNTGDYLGTLRYMSPERFRGECDASADIYSLGMTLYETVLRRSAFEAKDRIRLIYLVNNTEPPAPRLIDPAVPADLETIILKSIDKDSGRRYRLAKEFSLDLARFINDEPIAARRLTVVERFVRWSRRNRGLAAAVCSLVTLLILMAVGTTWAAVRESRLRFDAEGARVKAESALAEVQESRIAEKAALQAAEAAGDQAHAALVETEAARKLAEERRLQINRNLYRSEFRLGSRLLGLPGGRRKIRRIVERWQDSPDAATLIGWEWHLLNSSSQPDGLMVPLSSTPRAVEWSPDGKLIAIASRREVAVIDADTAAITGAKLMKHTNDVFCVAWHPSGRLMASGDSAGGVRFWDVETRKEFPKRMLSFENPVHRIAWAASGRQIALAVDREGVYQLAWSADATTDPQLLQGSPELVRYMDWSPDETHLAWGTWFQNSVAIYDVEQQQPVGENMRGTRVVWDDGNSYRQMIHATASGQIDLSDGESTRALAGHTQWVRTLDVSPDQSLLVSGGSDQKIYLWNLRTGHIKRSFVEHRDQITAVRFSPDGRRVASISNDSARIWTIGEPGKTVLPNSADLASPQSVRELRVTGLQWHPGDGRLASSSYDGYTRIWDVAGQRVVQRYKDLSFSVGWNPQGDRLAIGSAHGLMIADPNDSTQPLPAVLGGGVDWNADGTSISVAFGTTDRRDKVRVYAFPSLEVEHEWRAFPECTAWHPSDVTVLAFARPNTVVVVKDGDVLHELKGHSGRVRGLSWSPDGRRLVSCGDDALIRVHEVDTGQQIVLDAHSSAVWAVDWHPSGNRLASGGTDGTIRVWETQDWQEVLTLNGGNTAVSSVAWAPDGDTLATGNQLGEITIWNPDSGDEGPD